MGEKAFSMSSLITAVFKATIGLLVNKGRDRLAERLIDGDVTDQEFRGLIVREMNEMKSKLDGLARKNLLASISLFKEGIEMLYEVFELARPSSEHPTITTQTVQASAETRLNETFSLAEEMSNLNLTDLDESATRKLKKAMETFDKAHLEAIKAFSNEALELPDRLLAMQYRLMATILETVDNPSDALAACRVCLDELHQVPAVKEYFKVELERGVRLRARFNKEKRRQIIFSVCHVNRVIHDVMQMCGVRNLWTLPLVDTGKEEVDPLRDGRVDNALMEQGLGHFSVQWSFGQEEDSSRGGRLKEPVGIATNTKQQFLIADAGPRGPCMLHRWFNMYTVKVFDNNGKFVFSFKPETDDANAIVNIWDVATSQVDDKIYLLVARVAANGLDKKTEVQVFHKTAELQYKFPVRIGLRGRLSVSRNKVLMLTANVVDVHELSGEFVCTFGEGVFKDATDISVTCDGRVMIVDAGDSCARLLTEEGQQLAKFNVSMERDEYSFIAHHPTGEFLVVACFKQETGLLRLTIYTMKGDPVRKILSPLVVTNQSGWLDEGELALTGITVTLQGHIAVALRDKLSGGNVFVF